jgi:hypothetical protein
MCMVNELPRNHCLRTAQNRNSRSLAGNWQIVFQLVKGKFVSWQSFGPAHICGREEEVFVSWDI